MTLYQFHFVSLLQCQQSKYDLQVSGYIILLGFESRNSNLLNRVNIIVKHCFTYHMLTS